MRSLTRRGRWVGGVGVTTMVVAGIAGQRELLRFGILFTALVVVSSLYLLRSRYQLASARGLRPQRVSVDSTATVLLRLTNRSRLPTGLVLVEDPVPWQVGTSRRFVVDRLGSGASRDVRYDVVTTLRGRYEIGPLEVGLVDPFGLSRVTRTFTTTSALTVVPHTVDLPRIPLASDWGGVGESHSHTLATSGEDDVVPREYRIGDELRRVHWKASARANSLMVRREEQPLRTRATVLLDTRRRAHRGEGPSSSFEWAVAAAASVCVHMSGRGYGLRLLDLDARSLVPSVGSDVRAGKHDMILDALAEVAQQGQDIPGIVTTAARERAADGLVVAVLGACDTGVAERIAGVRRGRGVAIALILDPDAWPGRAGGSATSPKQTAAILSSAGWRVQVCDPATPLATAWSQLVRGRSETVRR